MKKRREEGGKGPCATPGCWQEARTTGFCSACYSAWRRLLGLTMTEIADYQRRIGRYGARVGLRNQGYQPEGAKKPAPKLRKAS